MERLFLVSVMITMCSASQKDLSGMMFTFPAETETDHVRLTPSGGNFSSVTVCLRYFTDNTRAVSLYSMALPENSNAFLLFKDPVKGMELLVNGVGSYSHGLPDERNVWVSLCGTWNSMLNQVWVNGKQGVRRLGHTGQLTGPAIIIVGQEQDSYGGKFDKWQSFVGHLSDIHMWDYVLSPCEIERFSNDQNFTPGNVLNWRALTFSITGQVILEDKVFLQCEMQNI